MDISFRPHHFLCAYCFEGRGYSPAFVANFTTIMANLANEQVIKITPHTDSICQPCPHRTNLSCSSQAKITQLDHAHATALDIQTQTSITWGEAKQRIRDKISIPIFQQICQNCEWQALGICEAKLKPQK